MITYKITDGIAHDLQFKSHPEVGDLILEGDVLPDIKTLHVGGIFEEKEKKEDIKRQLAELDAKSIRAMREWLAGVENPPSFIVQHNEQARELRKQL